MTTKKPEDAAIEQDAAAETLTRRKAIKRIAAILAGAAVSVPVLGQAAKELQFAYLSKAPYNPYADSVYASRQPDYQRYMSYYTSYRSHYTSVPPPYSSRR